MDGSDAIQAYWSGGPLRVRLLHAPGAFPSEDLTKAIEVVEDFRAECHKGYFAFNGISNGRLAILETFKGILEDGRRLMEGVAPTSSRPGSRSPSPVLPEALSGSSCSSPTEANLSIGDRLPPFQGRQKVMQSSVPTHDRCYDLTGREWLVSAGRASTGTATMNQGQFLDSLAKGGEFEDLQNKAFVVMLYHRWDEWYRHRIATALGLEKEKVRSSLMGEVRHLRNVLVHDNGMVPENFSAPLLSRAWGGVLPGFLFITDQMVTDLMEQLNAILVEVG